MIDSIISGISNALFEQFGYVNYGDKIPQDLDPPCFFIQCIEPKNKKYIGKRYLRRYHFMIQYFPQSNSEPATECNSVGETMFECLEVIKVDDFFLRGMEMKFEVVDDVLHFSVDYNAFVRKVEVKDEMETMGSDIHVKG